MLRRTWSFVIGATLVLATPGVVLAQAVEAGPIWNQADAQNKCPAVCQPGQWSGQWWTTRPGQMSVCQCSRPQPPPVVAPPVTRPRKLVVAELLQNAAGEILISQRRPDQPMGDWWEFPKGKPEPDETPEATLAREL